MLTKPHISGQVNCGMELQQKLDQVCSIAIGGMPQRVTAILYTNIITNVYQYTKEQCGYYINVLLCHRYQGPLPALESKKTDQYQQCLSYKTSEIFAHSQSE